LRGTESLLTHRWREMDSNHRSREVGHRRLGRLIDFGCGTGPQTSAAGLSSRQALMCDTKSRKAIGRSKVDPKIQNAIRAALTRVSGY
jgi:hypothetical protein